MLLLVSCKYLFVITSRKLSSCMNAKSFGRSGAGAVPINMPDDCLYTTPSNCKNPSSNTKLIYSHIICNTALLSQVIKNSAVGSAVEFLCQIITMFKGRRLSEIRPKYIFFKRYSAVIGRTLMY